MSCASPQLALGCLGGGSSPQPHWLSVGQSSVEQSGAGAAAVVQAPVRVLRLRLGASLDGDCLWSVPFIWGWGWCPPLQGLLLLPVPLRYSALLHVGLGPAAAA